MPSDVAKSLKVHIIAIIVASFLEIGLLSVLSGPIALLAVTLVWFIFVGSVGSSAFAVIDAQLKEEK